VASNHVARMHGGGSRKVVVPSKGTDAPAPAHVVMKAQHRSREALRSKPGAAGPGASGRRRPYVSLTGGRGGRKSETQDDHRCQSAERGAALPCAWSFAEVVGARVTARTGRYSLHPCGIPLRLSLPPYQSGGRDLDAPSVCTKPSYRNQTRPSNKRPSQRPRPSGSAWESQKERGRAGPAVPGIDRTQPWRNSTPAGIRCERTINEQR
jgi:hypothetical protein